MQDEPNTRVCLSYRMQCMRLFGVHLCPVIHNCMVSSTHQLPHAKTYPVTVLQNMILNSSAYPTLFQVCGAPRNCAAHHIGTARGESTPPAAKGTS